MSRKCGSLYGSQPDGPLRPLTGITSPFCMAHWICWIEQLREEVSTQFHFCAAISSFLEKYVWNGENELDNIWIAIMRTVHTSVNVCHVFTAVLHPLILLKVWSYWHIYCRFYGVSAREWKWQVRFICKGEELMVIVELPCHIFNVPRFILNPLIKFSPS
jgi:hypothetical protein